VYCLIIFNSREIKPIQCKSASSIDAVLHKLLEYTREKKGPEFQLPTYVVFHFLVYFKAFLKSLCLMPSSPIPVHDLVSPITYKV
jgi:hypothetical protein